MSPLDPQLVAEWQSARSRGKRWGRKLFIREIIAISAGVATFFVLAWPIKMLAGFLWIRFLSIETDHVALGDQLKTLATILAMPLLLALPLLAAIFVTWLLGRDVFFRR